MSNLRAKAPRSRRQTLRLLSACLVMLQLWLGGGQLAYAQSKEEKKKSYRALRLEWNRSRKKLYAYFSFRDVIDPRVRKKLKRGLPTTIVLTGTIYRDGSKTPLSTTAQTCKVTWLVWDEVYQIVITRPGSQYTELTPTVNGVLRRCARARRLVVATRGQVPTAVALYLKGKVQINPVSSVVLRKIKRWVSRPSGTGTASPGDALFSTFTGLFLQRIGAAEVERNIRTKAVVPTVRKKKKRKKKRR